MKPLLLLTFKSTSEPVSFLNKATSFTVFLLPSQPFKDLQDAFKTQVISQKPLGSHRNFKSLWEASEPQKHLETVRTSRTLDHYYLLQWQTPTIQQAPSETSVRQKIWLKTQQAPWGASGKLNKHPDCFHVENKQMKVACFLAFGWFYELY